MMSLICEILKKEGPYGYREQINGCQRKGVQLVDKIGKGSQKILISSYLLVNNTVLHV